MKRFKDISLRAKLILLIFSVSLVIVVLVGGARLVWDLQQDRHALEQELTTLTQLLGDRSSAALAFDDARLGKENLGSLQTLPHVMQACLYHSDGKLLAEYRRDAKVTSQCLPASRLPELHARFEADRFQLASAIHQGSQLLGWIYISSDLSVIESHLRSQMAFSLLALLAAILVASLLAGWVQRLVTGPVVAVTKAARAIERDGDYKRRAPVSSHDEVGELAQSFNAMLDALQARTGELASTKADREALLRRYRTLFDNASDVILLADADTGQILDINPIASERYGYTRDEFLGLTLHDLSAPEALADLPKVITMVREEGEAMFERLHRSKDGTTIPVEVSSRLIELDGRQVFLAIIRDLSERRQAQEQITQSETKFRSLFETANDAIFLMQGDHFIDCNPRTLTMFGCAREDIIGNTPMAFSPMTQYEGRDSNSAALEKIHAALEGKPQFFAWRHQTLDGSQFDAEVSLNRIDLGGQPCLQAIVRDVTTRKRTEEAIQNIAAGVSSETGEAFFRQLVVYLSKLFDTRYAFIGLLDEQDHMMINTLAVSMDGEIANNISYHLQDTPCANVVGQGTCAHPSGVQQEFPNDLLLQQMGVESYIGTPLFDTAGKPLGLIVLLDNKSLQHIEWMGEILQIFAARAGAELERVRAEQDLFVKDRAMEAATEGILLMDANQECIIVYANHAMELITGYPRSELLGKNPRILQGPDTDPATVNKLRDAVSKHQPCQVEMLNYRKDGTPFWNEISITPVQNENGVVTHFIGTQLDITERRHTEEALRRSQKMEAVGQLAGGVAHDFNNQLGIIIGYLDFLRDRLAGEDKPRQWVETATQATLRCIDLTRQLLAFSRRQNKETTIADINQELAKMDTLITRSITPAITLRSFPGEELWRVAIDPGEFQDAILNLVLNARDAMIEGGQLIIETTNKKVSARYAGLNPELDPGEYVQIMVSDTGCGMDKATMERVFEPFFTTKPEGKGTGLGLAMVYGFARRYGGHIKVYSEPGVGTTFRLYLPRASDSANDERQALPNEALPRGRETILIVDDEADLLRLAEQYLESLGYRVLTSDNPQDALKLLQENSHIDLLFSDVVMPGDTNGYALADQAVKLLPGLRVLLTSGFTANTIAINGQARFAANLLHKPYRQDELARRVRTVLDQESKA